MSEPAYICCLTWAVTHTKHSAVCALDKLPSSAVPNPRPIPKMGNRIHLLMEVLDSESDGTPLQHKGPVAVMDCHDDGPHRASDCGAGMSYAGERASCPHEGGSERNPNCRACIMDGYEEVGIRDSHGVLHASNGGNRPDAYCIGHIEKDPRYPDGDGRCTVLVRHCPVLNTPAQVKKNKIEDADLMVSKAADAVGLSEQKTRTLRQALVQAMEDRAKLNG